MSAIGSYSVVGRIEFPGCLARARDVRTETTGRWIFKQTRVVGIDEFKRAWRAAVRKSVDFEYSGYALGNYLDAQTTINGVRLFDEQSDAGRAFCQVFTAAFVFEQPVQLPELPPQGLMAFCREEHGEDAQGMTEAINAAHVFYMRGLAEITSENLVVFVIN
jgi:hypothetical protein